MKLQSFLLLFFLSGFLLLGFISCQKENLFGSSDRWSEEWVPVRIQPFVKSVGAGEDEIRSVRLIVFRTESDGSYTSSIIANISGLYDAPIDTVLKEGYCRILAIANEDPAWNLTDFSGTVQDLKALTATYNDQLIAPPFVMTQESDVIRLVKGANPVEITFSDGVFPSHKGLERLVAKVTLTLSCHYADLSAAIELEDIVVKGMPDAGYLFRQPTPYDLNYLDSQPMDLSNGSSRVIYDVNGFKTQAGGIVLYVPEYINEDITTFVLLELTAHLKVDPSKKIVYYFPLGDGMDKMPAASKTGLEEVDLLSAADLSLQRNTHYKINASIKGLGGDEFQFIVDALVTPWNTVVVQADENSVDRRFAPGNIVYNEVNGELEIAEIPTMEGLKFKWGSLIGLDPSVSFDQASNIFKPAGCNYNMTNNILSNVPYRNENLGIYAKNRDHFIAAYPGIGYDVAAGKGDICRYMSDMGWTKGVRYRMPTAEEYELLYNNRGSYPLPVDVWAPAPSGNSYGKAICTMGQVFGINRAFCDLSKINQPQKFPGWIFFPAAGVINGVNWSIVNRGSTGYYPSLSPFSITDCYFAAIEKSLSSVPIQSNSDKRNGFSVRCIKN